MRDVVELVRDAAPPTPGVFEENGLRIEIATEGGAKWMPFLTPDGRPIFVIWDAGGTRIDYRILCRGEDWRALEREMRQRKDDHDAALRRARVKLDP